MMIIAEIKINEFGCLELGCETEFHAQFPVWNIILANLLLSSVADFISEKFRPLNRFQSAMNHFKLRGINLVSTCFIQIERPLNKILTILCIRRPNQTIILIQRGKHLTTCC